MLGGAELMSSITQMGLNQHSSQPDHSEAFYIHMVLKGLLEFTL